MRTPATPQHRSDRFIILLTEYSLSNLGHFAVLAVLSLYFLRVLSLAPNQAAGLMLLAALSFRLTRLFLAPLLDRLAPRNAILLALALCAGGYLGMSVATTPLSVSLLLVLIGAGYGSNALTVKTLAAHSKRAERSMLLRYASLNTGLNVAAALGPIIGNALFLHWQPRGVFVLSAVAYLLAGLIALWLPNAELDGGRRPDWIAGLRLSLQLPPLRRAMLFATLGWFLYAQLYATLPLFVSQALGHPELLGTFFSLNALLIVTGQLPLSRLTLRWRLPAGRLVQLAFVAFAGGFILIWSWPIWQVTYVSVALWTLGEILLMPALDTLIAEGTPSERRMVAFALNSVAVGIGEGLGNFTGVSIAGWLLQQGQLNSLYGVLTFVAFVAIGISALVWYWGEERALVQRPAG